MNPDIQQKKFDFLSKYHIDILKEYWKHRDSTGYLRIYVYEDYQLNLDKAEFIKGEFNQDDFKELSNSTTDHPDNVVDAEYMYYLILWVEDKTRSAIKELALLHKMDAERFAELIKPKTQTTNK